MLNGLSKIFFALSFLSLAAILFFPEKWRYFFLSVFLLFIALVFLGLTKPKE